jgi:hypothetical protein
VEEAKSAEYVGKAFQGELVKVRFH